MGPERAELTQLADEYSKMDAEDVVGGVRTRFRYREVPLLASPGTELSLVFIPLP